MNEFLDLSVDSQTLRVTNRECEHREFKNIFDKDSLWKYAKTMAAFANRNGGVIFFGIKDKPRELIGVSGEQPDELVFANFVNEYFEPSIPFSLDTKKYFGKTLLYVLVDASAQKPILCKKKKVLQFKEKGKQDKELLREGAIYYRYSSASEEIKYPELQRILEERSQKLFSSLVENITLINKIGTDRVALVNADDLSGNDRTATVYITSETAKNINWIQKGRFAESEDEGEKAFYVTKEIEIRQGVEVEKPIPTDPSITHPITKTALTKELEINSLYINSVLSILGILDNPQYHFPQMRGKSPLHNFTEAARDKILQAYPLNMKDRRNKIKQIYHQYSSKQKKSEAAK